MSRRFALNTATTGSLDVLGDIHVAAQTGYWGIEFRDYKLSRWLDEGRSLYSLREALLERGVEAVSINALKLPGVPPANGEEDAARAQCRLFCEWAAELKVPYVVAIPGDVSVGVSPKEAVQITARSLCEIVEIASQFGVRIGFEFIGFPKYSATTLDASLAILEEAACSGAGLIIDSFHFYVGASSFDMLDRVDPSQLLLVHLSDAEPLGREQLTDSHRLLPGDGVIPLRELVKRLESLGYTGPYSIELFRPEYWAMEPVEVAKGALAKMKALF